MVISKNSKEWDVNITKLILDLGAIPDVLFSELFKQRLMRALEKCLERLTDEVYAQKTWLTHSMPTELLVNAESNHEELNLLAICCLQQVTLLQLLRNESPQYLRTVLKRLLQGGNKYSPALADTCYSRVTASRLEIAALRYLVHQERGRDWLSQHAPAASQLTGWTKAIVQGEIPPEQMVQLLTANRPSDSTLHEQRAYSPLVVMRWLLPLWRQPAVRQVIHRLNGGRGVQHLDAYLSRCLQRQDDVMQEEKGMQSVPAQVVPPQDNTVLSPDWGMESDAQQVALPLDSSVLPNGRRMPSDALQIALSRENAMLPEYEGIPAASRHTMQPGKGGLRLPNEPRSSSQGISNAGLLLLWPLLPQLFSLLGLWEEEQFVSDAARWLAVYGLDRLVWGDVSPTEGRLTLNQVLCGMSCSTSVPPSMPLSLLQLQQIDDWLAAIGQQLPGWQKLSLTDIRQLFLQRAGEISTEGIFHQISVRPEPYDFLLRDWPWPMTLASFPWTKQPLTIVWPLNGFTG